MGASWPVGWGATSKPELRITGSSVGGPRRMRIISQSQSCETAVGGRWFLENNHWYLDYDGKKAFGGEGKGIIDSVTVGRRRASKINESVRSIGNVALMFCRPTAQRNREKRVCVLTNKRLWRLSRTSSFGCTPRSRIYRVTVMIWIFFASHWRSVSTTTWNMCELRKTDILPLLSCATSNFFSVDMSSRPQKNECDFFDSMQYYPLWNHQMNSFTWT